MKVESDNWLDSIMSKLANDVADQCVEYLKQRRIERKQAREAVKKNIRRPKAKMRVSSNLCRNFKKEETSALNLIFNAHLTVLDRFNSQTKHSHQVIRILLTYETHSNARNKKRKKSKGHVMSRE